MANNIDFSSLPPVNRRVYEIIQTETKGNKTEFARSLGEAQQKIARLFSVDNRSNKYPTVSKNILKAIERVYNIRYNWLLTGEGEKYNSPNLIEDNEIKDDNGKIPLVTISAIGGELNGDDQCMMPYECESIISPIRNAQMAIRVSGDSMSPRYPNGSIVFIKPIDQSIFIEWGSCYVLNTTNGTIVKRVFKGENNMIECRSENPDYPPFGVPMDEVRKMYKILGALHLE